MGEITRADVINHLRRENPDGHEHDFAIYADSFLSYQAAAANIAKNGDIVLHPRTGQPIENPYNAIREKAAASLRKIALYVGNLWDNPSVFYVAISDTQADVPKPEEYEAILAKSAEDAADLACEDVEPPYVAWVKSEPTGEPVLMPVGAS